MATQDTSKILRFIEPGQIDAAASDFTPEERSVLDTINRRVAAGESLAAIMDFFFDAGLDICPCDRIGLAFVEEGGQRVVSHWAKALYEPMLLTKGYVEDLRGSSLLAVQKTGRLRIINDLEGYLRRKPRSASTALLVREGVRSSMTCPLRVEGRNAGFLFRSSRKAFAYGEHEVRLHQAVAERLSQAVEKAYRLEQLEAANQAYLEMLGFVSHELRSPLGSMVMDARLLTDHYLGELAPQQREKIEGIIRKAEYLLGMIQDYLDLARLEGGRLRTQFAAVDFRADILDLVIDLLQPQCDAQGTRIEIAVPEGPAPIECDLGLIRIAMANLLGNAVKYGNVNGKVRVCAQSAPDSIRVSVWNEGPGFAESDKSKLFRRFSRIQSPELLERKGTGVGLYTTWRIIQLHGGRIWADSEKGKWAEFTFEIPQPVAGSGSAAEKGEDV